MIGKFITGKSFGRCIAYCLEDKIQRQKIADVAPLKNRAAVLCYHQCFGDKKELAEQFRDVARLRPKQSKPVLHITLSLAPGEQLDRKNLLTIVQDCAQYMGFEKNQYIAVEHLDTTHQHIHIVANRIGFDGRVVSDSNNYKQMAQFCRKMEQQLNLQPVLSPRRYLTKEERQIPRLDSRKQALQENIKAALLSATTYVQFETKMKNLGYKIERGRGIAFTDDKGVRVKGSEVGYALRTIEKMVGEKREEKPVIKKEEKAIPEVREGSRQNETKEKKQQNDLLHALLKLERQEGSVAKEWLQKKKEQKRGLHL